ncbi:MAG TPA: peptidylprolyl isomerase [Dongiaceae bacterium]
MQMIRRNFLGNFLGAALLAAGLAVVAPNLAHAQSDPVGNTLYLDLKDGRVTILLSPNVAPKTVAHIKELVRKGFYNNTPIHRVIPGFMAQMGDPTGTGSGPGSGQTVPAEFNKLPFDRGTVGLARTSDPNSGDSQFFICFAPSPFLNGQYTVFGQVTSGMDVVDKIKPGDESNNGTVDNPDKIIKATLGDMK